MTLTILTPNQTEQIENKLRKQFGIKEIPGILVKKGQDRIFIFQGSLKGKEMKKLESWLPLERVGVYFAKEQNDEIRLSIEGTHILKNQIKNNIFDLNDEQLESWMHGNELNLITGKNTFLVMKYKDDLLGTGKASQEKITNFIPKSRRLKNRGNN